VREFVERLFPVQEDQDVVVRGASGLCEDSADTVYGISGAFAWSESELRVREVCVYDSLNSDNYYSGYYFVDRV
jgi:hypothetical protein